MLRMSSNSQIVFFILPASHRYKELQQFAPCHFDLAAVRDIGRSASRVRSAASLGPKKAKTMRDVFSFGALYCICVFLFVCVKCQVVFLRTSDTTKLYSSAGGHGLRSGTMSNEAT